MVRFNDAQFDIIDIKSSRAGMSRSEYIREGALSATVTGVLSDEEKMLLHELKKLGPNLNQIAHHANAVGFHSVADKAENIVDRIAGFILKLKNRVKT
ncbi:ribbon-helix-helix protein CopG family [Bacteroides sp. CAG:927]|nr:ribbon-helix-helix protein CopG family [Bacteroides sp. CAG:927]